MTERDILFVSIIALQIALLTSGHINNVAMAEVKATTVNVEVKLKERDNLILRYKLKVTELCAKRKDTTFPCVSVEGDTMR